MVDDKKQSTTIIDGKGIFLKNMSIKQDKLKDVAENELCNGFKGNFPFSSLMTKELIKNKVEYNLSKHWKITKSEYIKKITNRNRNERKCETCGKKTALQVHHLSYVNLGAETQKDLILLCYRCHSQAHNKNPEISGLEHKKKRRSIFKNMENKELGLEDYFTFGKYKNETVSEVIKKDKSYIEWCIKNNICLFDSSILQYAGVF